MEQKSSGSVPPSAVSDGPSPFDPLDIAEAQPLDDIDEATSARMREAWEESMTGMHWSCAKTIDDFPCKSPVLSMLWATDLDDVFGRLEAAGDSARGSLDDN
ncbi:hypothetical protein pdul_cds_947 [Pandoravirus dulcis]|uniref:Uncharacterized protein n=1 Tax=Pandoravirus dulcis TaxID=1349409 RepID=S4VYP5_9VIRU|nr:hypothetical protein pdul_cds_947 [Pandoravirus dulcis]AGO83196.2 hypothetical protein pdul_cds_947 [Pandoravirus dulcis]